MRRTLLIALLLCACERPRPAPSVPVATLVPGRAGVTLRRGAITLPVPQRRRVAADDEVHTAAGVRAALYLDRGAWVLLDGGSAARLTPDGLSLHEGRAWVDARGADPLKVLGADGQVALTLTSAGLSLSAVSSGAHVYCASGQVTWQSGAAGGRLESGLSLIYKDGQPKETAQALWEDWTLGLAEPGPLRPQEPAGVGQLLGRRPDEAGEARAPLIVRNHEVRVRVQQDRAETTVEQVFFNPRSEVLEGLYAVRLPERAVLEEFAVGLEDSAPQAAQVAPRARAGAAAESAMAQLEWAGPGRYRGLLRGIRPGKTVRVMLRYREWLPRLRHPDGARRSYVYPMGASAGGLAGEAPSLGEFALEVDLSDADAAAVEAGMGAQVEGRRVVLRRSDFRPRADFVLDLLDGAKRPRPAEQRAFRGTAREGVRYLLTQPVLDPGPPPQHLRIVLLVDASAATDPAHLDLARGAAQALLQQLGEGDRVAVLAASSSVRSLGREAMGPASRARVEELLDALGKVTPGGATDLGAAFARALQLLPGGDGAIVYVGDGRPTQGPLLPGELRDQLQRLGVLPRIYAIAVGAGADRDLLGALCTGGTAGVVPALDRPEATRAALHLLERAAQPALTAVTVSLGEGADVVYPEGPVTVEGGEALEVVARLRSDRPAPRRLLVAGLRGGEPFREERKLTVEDVADGGDLARRWAQARLVRLLERGAGREAAADIGTRFQLVTPWTALMTGGGAYALIAGEEERGTFVPPALRGRAPEDGPVALEDGVSTAPSRGAGLPELYRRALAERQQSARVCYDRRAAGHPELSGRVVLKVKVGLDGAVQLAKVQTSTLRAREVEACIERALGALRLPPPPDGKAKEVLFAMQLEQPEGQDGGRACSAASRAYLAARRAIWRERLARNPGAGGAMAVWREARARCELRSWVDRRALLDLLRPHVGRTADQVDLYHRFDGDPDQGEVQEHLRREILRALRTQEDVRAAQLGLQLDGGVDPDLVDRELLKAKTPAQQIALLRQFLQLAPGALALKLRLMRLLEQTGQKAEALRLAETLRGDPGADAAVRQAVGELLLRTGDGAEGARALSEIVEFAPFDPWARRRLGDLYLGHRLHEAAYREYQTLGWLLPQDDTVLLRLSSAAFGAGRSDEALRLLLRVAEAVGSRAGAGPAAWARALYAARYGQLLDEARRRGDKNQLALLLARGRSDGVAGFIGGLLLAALFDHPDGALELRLGSGPDALAPANLHGRPVGIDAQRYERAPGDLRLISVRRAPGPARDGELIILYGLREDQVLRQPLRLGDGKLEARFAFTGRALEPR